MSLICGETTPPIVDITSHTWNQNVSGTITITATASDSGSGVDFVQFYFGGDLISTDSSSPYSSTSITVKNYKEGAQTIAVAAFDNDGNFAADNVIVNVVINDYDWSDTNMNNENSDSVVIWWHTYDIYIDNTECYGIGDNLRKVEFDWYTDDYSRSGIVCKWSIYGGNFILYPTDGLLDSPSTNPTHVTMIFGPEEFTSYYYLDYLYIHVYMYRNGNLILDAAHELLPST
ncbi:MAG: Ig-like domain-containing protein [Candidatus Heimdallarchaeota archaeon]